MGLRDTEEMLEVAKAETIRMERAIRAALNLHSSQTLPQSHLGLNVPRRPSCDVRYPCKTRRVLEATS